jgi:hypothetical protein
MSTELLIDKILDAIDRGVTTSQLREDYSKYIISGKTKKIIICTGGEGLKISRKLLEEMKNRGDKLATTILEKDEFYVITYYGSSSIIKDEYYHKNEDKHWAYLENDFKDYDRENKILIDIIEEDKIENIGGWTLEVVDVPIENWSYKICKSDDHWGCEYISYVVKNNRERQREKESLEFKSSRGRRGRGRRGRGRHGQ